MAAERLSSVLRHITPGKSPLDTMYVDWLLHFPAFNPMYITACEMNKTDKPTVRRRILMILLLLWQSVHP